MLDRLVTAENKCKEVIIMPTLRHLLEELGLLGDPDKVRIPGQVYDRIVDETDDFSEEED